MKINNRNIIQTFDTTVFSVRKSTFEKITKRSECMYIGFYFASKEKDEKTKVFAGPRTSQKRNFESSVRGKELLNPYLCSSANNLNS
ncbi:MAG: hypothetical protein RIQ59_1468 [Bacteroidota bacterium]|jgi:hypothetical protein